MIVNDPQYLSRSILRSEIQNDVNNDHYRTIHRVIFPRYGIDEAPLQQIVIFDRETLKCHYETIIDEFGSRKYYIKVPKFTFGLEFETLHVSVPSSLVLTDAEKHIFDMVLCRLVKFGHGKVNGYVKRVHHDTIVPKIDFQNRYDQLKRKYKFWAQQWTEKTDPSKHVFEDISIASFLISLWNLESTFVDLGCGNGFLTHLLSEEGFEGYGIDLFHRKSWEMYGSKTRLLEEKFNPKEASFPNVEWIIGNHPDELTLWIPIIAAKSHFNAKFIIIPCCCHELSGEKYKMREAGFSKYQTYVKECEKMMEWCGYQVEKEYLRIPSTKNLALVGRKRTILPEQEPKLLSRIQQMTNSITIHYRMSDKLH